MRDETYLYEDTLLKAVNALLEDEWEYSEAQSAISTLLNAGLVIREREPRDEDLTKKVSNQTLTGGFTGGKFSTGGPVPGSLYYEYRPGMSIDLTSATSIRQAVNITNEENEK